MRGNNVVVFRKGEAGFEANAAAVLVAGGDDDDGGGIGQREFTATLRGEEAVGDGAIYAAAAAAACPCDNSGC